MMTRRSQGFTLIELLVSLALIGLFASLAQPLMEMTVKRNREAELRSALQQIRGGLDAYKQAVDDGRVVTKPGDSGYPKNLEVLVTGVPDSKSPEKSQIYFLRRIPRDPFAEGGAEVKAENTWGKRSYKSPPDRPRPGDDVYDVYSLSTETGINGIPYAEW